MPDYQLTSDQEAIQSAARDFAEGEIRPLAARLDEVRDPLAAFPWDLIERGSEFGFRTAALPEALGGMAIDALTSVITIDELAYEDPACARLFAQQWSASRLLHAADTQATRAVLSRFADDPKALIGSAWSEPEIAASAGSAGIMLNGAQRFVNLGGVARWLLIPVVSENGPAHAILEREQDGLSCGPIDDKTGMRIDHECEVVLDRVGVASDALIAATPAMRASHVVELCACAMGLARSSLDVSTRFANTRIQGGRTIIGHQAVGLTLADQYIALQTGRGFLWRVAAMLDRQIVDEPLIQACAAFCGDAVVSITRNAVELLGATGVMREMPTPRHYRDALVLRRMLGASPGQPGSIGQALLAHVGGDRDA